MSRNLSGWATPPPSLVLSLTQCVWLTRFTKLCVKNSSIRILYVVTKSRMIATHFRRSPWPCLAVHQTSDDRQPYEPYPAYSPWEKGLPIQVNWRASGYNLTTIKVLTMLARNLTVTVGASYGVTAMTGISPSIATDEAWCHETTGHGRTFLTTSAPKFSDQRQRQFLWVLPAWHCWKLPCLPLTALLLHHPHAYDSHHLLDFGLSLCEIRWWGRCRWACQREPVNTSAYDHGQQKTGSVHW